MITSAIPLDKYTHIYMHNACLKSLSFEKYICASEFSIHSNEILRRN